MSLIQSNITDSIDKFTPSSSFLELAEYDKKSYSMTLTFKNGNQYKYLWVFPTVWATFKQSPDHSSYYSRAIKGKLLAVALKKSNTGQMKSTPLHKHQTKRGLNNGKRYVSNGSIRTGSKGKRPKQF